MRILRPENAGDFCVEEDHDGARNGVRGKKLKPLVAKPKQSLQTSKRTFLPTSLLAFCLYDMETCLHVDLDLCR